MRRTRKIQAMSGLSYRGRTGTARAVRHFPRLLAAVALALAAGAAHAWNNHALLTWVAAGAIPALAGAPAVRVEPLERFLSAREAEVAALLEREEAWAVGALPAYAPRPAALAFRTGGDPVTRRTRFLRALRVNPDVRLAAVVQLRPRDAAGTRALARWQDVTTLSNPGTLVHARFARLSDGESVAPLDVLATASDEPDWGLDLGLWADNGTETGGAYGYGRQPYGNPALEFSSQSPFHMAFLHESAIVYAAAPFLKRTYAQQRIHVFSALAALALRSGHPYWGWRFAGWALHYVQDLAQPYHATVLPGVSVPRMLLVNALNLLGVHGPMRDAVALVSNRHLALENWAWGRLGDALRDGRDDDPLVVALRGGDRAQAAGSADERWVFATVTARANAAAAGTDETLERALPARYVSDPSYVFGETDPDVDLVRQSGALSPQALRALDAQIASLFAELGRHTRTLVGSLPGAAPAPSKASP